MKRLVITSPAALPLLPVSFQDGTGTPGLKAMPDAGRDAAN